ncbi:putative N-acetylmuramoyl-L-alanine amidase [Azorhizobium caulinodans ORS 571]|uniref:Putative N-acetylmuramoyl-L-alanine amidase n=1 Tax=Azorhizobium caulinodans (strain ATCC 43989 / DSM 5975 / JCM 20966 / LMG 6465 / NBRC 14845 / NCIMB 13405 / ORS 571) TaxID=438753 RepID=A8IFC3_AZOC5|nr:N-acetylmuramoyl-L-alanine amidase [Azorhizobium caulinodans]BAF89599.1 putative N-acetylmuramoyl-L-alanine amidase [Azorhizobium caulinodans ORS 571]
MRKITHIVIHCAATPEGREVSVKEIDRWHRERGFAKIGYHYVIHLDGSIDPGRSEEEIGAHVQGHNATSIGICYIGGTEAHDVKKPKDTRTPAQKAAMERLVKELLTRYPGAEVLGHNDFPGVNKACPAFDTRKWWAEVSKRDAAPAPQPAFCKTCGQKLP